MLIESHFVCLTSERRGGDGRDVPHGVGDSCANDGHLLMVQTGSDVMDDDRIQHIITFRV